MSTPTIRGLIVQQVSHMAVAVERFAASGKKRAWALGMIRIGMWLRRIELKARKK